MKTLSLWVNVVLGIYFAVGSCRAGTVSVNLISPDNNGNPSVNINNGDGTNNLFGYSYSGAVKWTQNSKINPTIGSPFYTFCIEINQEVIIGSQNNIYTLTNLADAPVPGPVPNKNGGSSTGMGMAPADAITRLWHGFYGNSPTAMNGPSSQALFDAAAFQLAVWRIEYDWNSSSTLTALQDFTSGNFRANSTAKNPSNSSQTVVGFAQQLLADVFSDDGNYSSEGGLQLIALTSRSLQDQVTVATPEPSSICLALIGIGAGVLFCRRRKRSASGSLASSVS